LGAQGTQVGIEWRGRTEPFSTSSNPVSRNDTDGMFALGDAG